VEFSIDKIFQIFHRVFDLRGKQIMGHRTNIFTHVRNEIGIGNNHLIGLLLT